MTPAQPLTLAQQATPVHKDLPEVTIQARQVQLDLTVWAIKAQPAPLVMSVHKDQRVCLPRDLQVRLVTQDPPVQAAQDPQVQLATRVRLNSVLGAI